MTFSLILLDLSLAGVRERGQGEMAFTLTLSVMN